MIITREMLIKRLAEKSGYFQRDIRAVLHCLDEVVLDCFNEVTEADSVNIQLLVGCKLGCKIVPERNRKDPRTQEDIVCPPTVKPKATFSKEFKAKINEIIDGKE